ncbi:MAG: D-hexose-6-phosphate mutarotase [Solirubrobacterales bacterium]
MNLDQLNKMFGIGGRVRIVEGKGGFAMVAVDTPAATALISTYAGQVLSYRPAGQAEDVLFVSERAYWAEGKAIKGGIPVCWPWFGPDPEGQGRAAHGFVRNRPWALVGTDDLGDGRVRVRLGLADSAETRAIWPQAFELELWATVGPTLDVELITRNLGATPFTVTQALHTYLRVGDIRRAEVQGLDGVSYIDKMDGGAVKTQAGPVTIAGEVDRIYSGVGAELAVADPALGRTIRIASLGSASAVVWNPWVATAAAMGDLDHEDYKRMLCVETTNAGADVRTVPARGQVSLGASFAVG